MWTIKMYGAYPTSSLIWAAAAWRPIVHKSMWTPINGSNGTIQGNCGPYAYINWEATKGKINKGIPDEKCNKQNAYNVSKAHKIELL